ncbi:MAG: hypothetical protein ACI8RZ_003367 [Myxococcota bacterium]|jgi:hypothetical protein
MGQAGLSPRSSTPVEPTLLTRGADYGEWCGGSTHEQQKAEEGSPGPFERFLIQTIKEADAALKALDAEGESGWLTRSPSQPSPTAPLTQHLEERSHQDLRQLEILMSAGRDLEPIALLAEDLPKEGHAGTVVTITDKVLSLPCYLGRGLKLARLQNIDLEAPPQVWSEGGSNA